MVLKVNLGIHEPEALRRGRRLEQLRGFVPARGFDQRATAPGRSEPQANFGGSKRHQRPVPRALHALPLSAVHRRPERLSLR